MSGLMNSQFPCELNLKQWEYLYRHDLKDVYKQAFEKNKYIQCKYEDYVTYCYNHSSLYKPSFDLGQPAQITNNVTANNSRYGKTQTSNPDDYFDFLFEFYEDVHRYINNSLILILDKDKFTDFLNFFIKYADCELIDNEISQQTEKEIRESMKRYNETLGDDYNAEIDEEYE